MWSVALAKVIGATVIPSVFYHILIWAWLRKSEKIDENNRKKNWYMFFTVWTINGAIYAFCGENFYKPIMGLSTVALVIGGILFWSYSKNHKQ